MRVELLSVGTELLLGQIVDTNASYLAKNLSELGINVFHKTTVGDNPERLAAALRISLGRCDVVLATGGLGPTQDDVTAAAVADVMGVGLALDEAAAERIRSFAHQRGIELLDSLLKQAWVPEGSLVVPNPVGTAPGFIITRDVKTVIALPGPPPEMNAMAEATVLPYLAEHVSKEEPAVLRSRVLRLAGIGESQAEAAIADLIEHQTNPTIAPLAKPQEIWLRLTARAKTSSAAAALIEPIEREIRRRIGEHAYGADDETLETVIGDLLKKQSLTIAIAESCTGGLIGNRLTNVSGSSAYFLASLVTYSNESKVELLGISADTLRQHGAVSAQTAKEMAQGVRGVVGANIGLAVTGIAGPTGGTPEKPVGLIYIGYADDKAEIAEELRLRGNRLLIKERAAQMALFLLHRRLRAQAGVEVRT